MNAREVESEFHIFGAITTGMRSALEDGVNVTTGAPEEVAARFREHAAPGQVLLSEQAWSSAEHQVDVALPGVPVAIPGREPVPSYPLTGLL